MTAELTRSEKMKIKRSMMGFAKALDTLLDTFEPISERLGDEIAKHPESWQKTPSGSASVDLHVLILSAIEDARCLGRVASGGALDRLVLRMIERERERVRDAAFTPSSDAVN